MHVVYLLVDIFSFYLNVNVLSESVSRRRTENTIAKRKRTKGISNDLQSTTHKTKDPH